MTEIKCIYPKYRRILLLNSNLKIQETRNQSENGKSEHVNSCPAWMGCCVGCQKQLKGYVMSRKIHFNATLDTVAQVRLIYIKKNIIHSFNTADPLGGVWTAGPTKD